MIRGEEGAGAAGRSYTGGGDASGTRSTTPGASAVRGARIERASQRGVERPQRRCAKKTTAGLAATRARRRCAGLRHRPDQVERAAVGAVDSRRSARGGSGRSAVVAPTLRARPRGRQRPPVRPAAIAPPREAAVRFVLPRMRADNESDAAGRRDDPARQGCVAGRLGRSCGYNRRMSAKELDRRWPQSPHRSSWRPAPGQHWSRPAPPDRGITGRRGTTPPRPSPVRRAPGRAGRRRPA